MSLPKISIIIPSYNKADYIDHTLKSIIDQDYPNLEVIIQDGGSTDGTVEVIKKYAKNYPNIIQWVSKKDKGQVDAINIGLKKAKGNVLAFINADDVYEPGALKTVGEYFSKYPETLWLAGRGRVIDKNGKEIAKAVTAYKNYLMSLNSYHLLLIVNYLMQPSVFISKRAYKQYGPFTGTRKFVLEYDLWLKMGKIKMPSVIKTTLSGFRMSGENISSVTFKYLLEEDELLTKRYTKNPVFLFLHKVNNEGRKFIVRIS